MPATPSAARAVRSDAPALLQGFPAANGQTVPQHRYVRAATRPPAPPPPLAPSPARACREPAPPRRAARLAVRPPLRRRRDGCLRHAPRGPAPLRAAPPRAAARPHPCGARAAPHGPARAARSNRRSSRSRDRDRHVRQGALGEAGPQAAADRVADEDHDQPARPRAASARTRSSRSGRPSRVPLVREGLRSAARSRASSSGLLLYSGNDDALALAMATGGGRHVPRADEPSRALARPP